MPAIYDGINAAQDVIAACLADEHRRFRALLSQRLRERLDEGVAIGVAEYDAALTLARQCRRNFAAAIEGFDVLVVSGAPGETPCGLAGTGDPVFNRTWSLMHTPSVQGPITLRPKGLPLGLQVVGRIGVDARTWAAAHWIETRLREPAAGGLPP